MIQKRLLILGALAILLVPAVPVLAEDGDVTANPPKSSEVETETHGSNGRLAEAQTKLQDAKLKACQNREASIDRRLQNIVNRGDRQVKVFDTIATRVEQFASDKNAKPSNYDDLVNTVASQKAAAQAAMSKIEADRGGFKCNGNDPKGSLETFRTDLKTEISALKSYRTSIKNLIVGVKTSLSSTSSTEGAGNDQAR